jgi:Protein kinase domain
MTISESAHAACRIDFAAPVPDYPPADGTEAGLPALARMQAARAPLREGDPRRMGRYRLTARLGSGGMGVVYLGVAGNGRLVAVKVLRPELADDPLFRARFSREAAALARVRGARVVRVIEAGIDSRAHFLVTEYAAGPSLSRYVDSAGPLGPEMLHRLAAGLAEALTTIHAAGVVHRDLKPANVIMGMDGPKVIDFGIAQVLDLIALTRTGMTVGSPGYMSPEQVTGQAGPPADVFAWAVTVAYAASGRPPFGTGPTEAVIYRVLHAEPDIAAVPRSLRPVVEAALAKEPHLRPIAGEIFSQLTAGPAAAVPAPVPARAGDGAAAAPVLAARPPDQAEGETGQAADKRPSAVCGPDAPSPKRPAGRHPHGRGMAIEVAAVALAGAAALGLVLGVGRGHHAAHPVGDRRAASQPSAAVFATYPGLLDRGVFQTISRSAASGNTIVTTGAQVADGTVRQQFFASADGGAAWQLAAVRGLGGGPAPAGYAATRIAGGPAGWLAVGPQAIWTSRDGLSWTLAASHGITPQVPGDQLYVLTATASGFLAGGQAATPGGGSQAVLWTSRDGLTWQRLTAAEAGLGRDVTSISYAATSGGDTVIAGTLASGGWGTWLSTDGGTAWTKVSIAESHGAQNTISGLAADGSGLIAVRPGTAGDAVAYFSVDGRSWQYAATIGAAGGFRPAVVRGSAYGFAVTGTGPAGDYLAYTAAGDGTAWTATGSLGSTASYASAPAGTAGADGTVIAVGSAGATKTGQQAVVLRASTTGTVQAVPVDRMPGAITPEVAVSALASAGGQQIAVGSADGYPAIWRKTSGGSWTLTSKLPLVSAAGPGRSALTSITHGPHGWLAVGTPGPIAYTSVNGVNWRPAAGSIAADLRGVVGVAAAAGPRGYAIVGKLIAPGGSCVADVWWSPDLTHWARAHDVNDVSGSSQVLADTADQDGFYSVGSHNGQPAVWETTDGTAWSTVVLPLPAGASGVLQQVAVQGNRVTALGTQTSGGVTTPLAEVSADGGVTWTRVALGAPSPDVAVTALTAGPAGFTAAIQTGTPPQPQVTIWTSANGTAWTQGATSQTQQPAVLAGA